MFNRAFKKFLIKKSEKEELYPYLYSIAFKELGKPKKEIKAEPLKCKLCGAIFTDTESIKENAENTRKLYRAFQRITLILLNEVVLRKDIRDAVKRNITELIELINILILNIRNNLPKGKELLIIIDDLEKIPDVNKANELFNEAGYYMTTPKCKIIYTIPIALYYSIQFKQVMNIFNSSFLLS